MRKQAAYLVLALLATVGMSSLPARADLQQLITETQRLAPTNGGFRIVWWIPVDYWRESFKNTQMTQAQSDSICKSLDDYIIFAIADVKIGPIGGITPVARDQMVTSLSVQVGDGQEMKPLSSDQLSPDVKNFLDMMKPAMTNMLGQFGSGLEFIAFPGKDAAGARLIDARKEGMLRLNYADSIYKFRLPLGSLLPPKYDPQTGERFLGNYIYSPFTGVKLVDAPPPQKP